ncbi:MAG: hypothetical protein AVDCRST_MAG61-2972 [uncultured Friedmanniella sp.]|uniref:Uncharacterized protein n=1 Tax=uncultured Friedmanniella sp. TaxID=335381 RepID=A0A6J4LLS8_9ACTN|nr:MAG: hypothetical protein AVDCRST_MAG61-2972 [uncultured Friedmanniella sp.]
MPLAERQPASRGLRIGGRHGSLLVSVASGRPGAINIRFQ